MKSQNEQQETEAFAKFMGHIPVRETGAKEEVHGV